VLGTWEGGGSRGIMEDMDMDMDMAWHGMQLQQLMMFYHRY
jgi:hypothetical protein